MTFGQLDGESLKLSRESGMGRVTVLREVISFARENNKILHAKITKVSELGELPENPPVSAAVIISMSAKVDRGFVRKLIAHLLHGV